MSAESESSNPEVAHENVVDLSAERAARKMEELEKRWKILRDQVDKNHELIDSLNLRIENISDLTKRRSLASEAYELEDETTEKLLEMMEIENSMQEIQSILADQ